MKNILVFFSLIFLLGIPLGSDSKEFLPFDHDFSGIEKHSHFSVRNSGPSSTPGATFSFVIRFFQVFISPMDGPNCIYHPTCSRYAKEAIALYGAIPGALMAADRVLRCNPLGVPSEDYPEDNYFFSKKRKK